ncbi:germination lipoprotein GerS-related protein [Clostridium fermenticellae]|uniref:germination lipoprotein GerS-related protein n=1 Tax=Clostridium fermenticellae TaxID=2068654 RepID=UPI001FA9C5E0|nr:germination lipoprotein GerS-related protein [Clostridium fermenticellae]
MKRVLLISLCLLIAVFQIGCENKDRDAEKNLKYIRNLDSYVCNVNISMKNDKQTVTYSGKQFYDKTYGLRFNLGNNRIYIYKDENVFVKDLKSNNEYTTRKDSDSIFKLSFVAYYITLLYTDENIKNSFKKLNNEEYQIVSLDIPGNNKNVSSADLYIRLSDKVPKYLYVYGLKGKENIKVEYLSFDPNRKLSKRIFDTK